MGRLLQAEYSALPGDAIEERVNEEEFQKRMGLFQKMYFFQGTISNIGSLGVRDGLIS